MWLSDNGNYTSITSIASDFVSGDTNGEFDVFLIDGSGGGGATLTSSATHTASPGTTPSSTPTATLIPATATLTPSVTPRGTLTPPTETPTPSVTPTGTLNPTELPTVTESPTPIVTGTPPIAIPTLEPTKFLPTVTPISTTVPPRHHFYLPLRNGDIWMVKGAYLAQQAPRLYNSGENPEQKNCNVSYCSVA